MVLLQVPRPDGGTRETVLAAAVRGMRPRQWLKNVLVAGAPFAAGTLFRTEVLAATLATFVAFCLVSSGVYLANDARDVEADRRHPTKRFRPIASGALPLTVAWPLAGALAVAGLLLGFRTDSALGITLLVYLALQAAYSGGLKQEAVVDLAIVASGFLLRAVAGGVASDIVLSQWFLLVASFGSLFMVAGKRYSELHALGSDGETRACLLHYSESYLRFVWALAAAVTVICYSLWALEHAEVGAGPWATLSIAPFVLALLRYAVDVDKGVAGAPEDIVLRDRVLQALGASWLLFLGLAVFAG